MEFDFLPSKARQETYSLGASDSLLPLPKQPIKKKYIHLQCQPASSLAHFNPYPPSNTSSQPRPERQGPVNPILRHLLTEASGIKSARVEEHVRLVQERKRQELRDYVIVCIQRLDPQRPSLLPPPDHHSNVHAIMLETLRRWKD